MTHIEDMPWASGGLRHDPIDALVEERFPGKEGDGVKVALDRACAAQRAPAFIEIHTPIQTDDIRAHLPNRGQQRRRIHAKVDDGHPQGLHPIHQMPGNGQNKFAIVGGAERARPTIEDLDHVGARLDLLRGKFEEHGGQLLKQQRPRGRLASTSMIWYGYRCASRRPRSCSWPE